MNASEAAILLGVCAAYDRRTVGKVDAIAWGAALDDIGLDDAKAAVVEHYKTTRDWIMPSDVRRLVKTMREARLARVPAPAPPTGEDAPYREALRREINRIAGGWSIGKALTRGGGAEPGEEYLEVRGEDPRRRELRLGAMTVRCPRCGVLANERCVNAVGNPLSTEPAHEARLVAAGLAEWVDGDQQRARLITIQLPTFQES